MIDIFGTDTVVAIVVVLLFAIGFIVWAIRESRPTAEELAHKGCPMLKTSIFTAEGEFVDAIIYLHEQDARPYLLLHADGAEDVRVPYENFLRLSVSDNTGHKNPSSGFGLDYRDFTGDALVRR